MNSTYRIIMKDGWFYPQYKCMFFWCYFIDYASLFYTNVFRPKRRFTTMADAHRYISDIIAAINVAKKSKLVMVLAEYDDKGEEVKINRVTGGR